MLQRDPKSILIAVEGIDGTGKSSAVPVIEDVCQRCGYDTITTREPYTQEVIDLVHSSQKGNLCEAMIRDRVQHLNDVILPHLSKSKSAVITDRYLYSNVAYNADEVPPEKILEEHKEREIPDADILVLLDMPVRVAQQRIMKTRGFLDPIEKRSMTQARKLFRSMANKHPCAVIVDASKPLEIVHEELRRKMARVIRVRQMNSELDALEDSMFP
jgi:dTMP kinase